MRHRISRLAEASRTATAVVGLIPAALSLAALAGCADAPPGADWPSEVSLAALLPVGAQPVGVAVSPEGKRYVLDRLSGLYELGRESAIPVFKTSELASRYGQRADLDLTDVVALGSEQFAITAENDGFLLDLHGGTFTSYFCYLPSAIPSEDPAVVSISQALQQQGVAVKQRTESVAFNANAQVLFAQPQTIRLDTGAVAGSELFVFRAGGGEPIQVRAMAEPGFIAGGMVALPRDRLLLGSGNSIFEGTLTGTPTFIKELTATIEIGGMARHADGSLLVLDRAANRLLTIGPL